MIKYLVLLNFIFLVQCPWQQKEYFLEQEMIMPLESQLEQAINNCNSVFSYLPDTLNENINPVKYIRINFHFMNSSRMDQNYNGEAGIKYAQNLVYQANRKLQFNKKMNLPEGNKTPVYYPRYQYVITPSSSDEDDRGIYFHGDDELYYFINEGKRNNYKTDVIKKYKIGEDSILNVFYMVHHPDSIRSKTYSGSASGIAIGKSIKMGTKYNPKDDPWKYASLLNHEIGHVMGLGHTWNLNDGCDDTPKNPNCWVKTNKDPCNGIVSNNMMDYNSNQHAITPCQISRVRKNIARLKSRQRDLVEERWCNLDVRNNVLISDKKHFSGAKDLEGNLEILSGGELKVSCRLSMPAGGEIKVQPGGKLILDGARLHNSCGKIWKGIKVIKKGKKAGEVFYIEESKIENTEKIEALQN